MNTIVVQSSEVINVAASELFEEIAGKDSLRAFDNIPFVHGFTPVGPLESNQKAGSERIIFFADSNSARQTFLTFIPNWSFSVRIDNFTSMCLSPLSEVEYQFSFFDLGNNRSIISTNYQFKMRSRIEMFLFKYLLKGFMQRHLDHFLDKMAYDTDRLINGRI